MSKSNRTTTRQRVITRAALIIIDSGNPDLEDKRIGEALNGVAELSFQHRIFLEGVELGSRREKQLILDVRSAVMKHPRYKEIVTRVAGEPKPGLVVAAQIVVSNLDQKIEALGAWGSSGGMKSFLENNRRLLQTQLKRLEDGN